MKRIFLILSVFFLSLGLFSQKTDVEKLLQEGKKAYAEGRFEEAISKLKLAISLIQNRQRLVEAYLELGLTYFTIGETEKAREALRNALSINPRLVLDPEYYPPKFLTLAEEVRKDFIINIRLKANVAAEFRVDGELVGRGTLIPVSLPRGKHKFIVGASGYGTVERELEVKRSGEVLVFNLAPVQRPKPAEGVKVVQARRGRSRLLYYIGGGVALGGAILALVASKKGPNQGTLKITTVPSGATIEIDGEKVGKSPLTVNVAPGTHEVKAVIDLFGEATAQVKVERGKTHSVTMELAPYKYRFKGWKEGFLYPVGITVGREGNVYFTEYFEKRVVKLGPEGGFIKASPPFDFLLGPTGIHYSMANDQLYFIGYMYGVFILDKRDLSIKEGFDLHFDKSVGLTSDGTPDLYISDSGRIFKFSPASGEVIDKWDVSNPNGITYLDGVLYITQCTNHRILKLDVSGNRQGEIRDSRFVCPSGIDSDGVSLYVGDWKKGKIYKMLPGGKIALSFGPGEEGLVGLAVDKNTGDVWATWTEKGRIGHWKMLPGSLASSPRVKVAVLAGNIRTGAVRKAVRGRPRSLPLRLKIEKPRRRRK